MLDKDHFYHPHLFFCTNQREGGTACSNFNSSVMRDHAKQLCAELGLSKWGRVRINTSGCLGRCELRPVIVVYPEGIWHTYADIIDVKEIIHEHVVRGRIVERLKI